MKNSFIPPIQAVILFLACASMSDAKADTDSKDKQIHHMQLQLRAVQEEKSELASQVETLKKQAADLESKRMALEKKFNGQSRQIAELADKQMADKQQQAELADKYRLLEQQYAASSKELQQTKMEKEQEKKKLDAEIQTCEKKNTELYQITVKLMDKYQAKGVLEAMLQKEPFTQLEKVKFENLLQEYRDKSDANRISPSNNGVQDVQHH